MNKIQNLIEELCPEGVSWELIGEHIDYEQPTKYIVESTDYSDSNPTPVLTAGQTFILGHTDETLGIYEASPVNPVIIFDDFTTAFKWVDFPFKVKSSAMKILTLSKKSNLSLRFLFHYMGVIGFSATEHARHWISIYSQIEIPVPPAAVQQEIVLILDKMTELEGQLDAELNARLEQYDYFKSTLLEPKNGNLNTGQGLWKLIKDSTSGKVSYAALSECTNLAAGERVTKAMTSKDGQYPLYGAGTVPTGFFNAYNFENCLIFSRAGAGAGFVNFIATKFWATDVCFVANQLERGPLIKFVYYWMKASQVELMKHTYGGSMPKIDKKYLWNFPVPLPPLPVQEEIISILDGFARIVSDADDGIPAEITARRQQYDYYRNKLLTFKELKAS
jgi:type I restriction enzyme S subunit